ncbi:shikimate dehydrogenase [Enemella dayhoffiae]|uniref:Shikimate dehydrogenase n=1 Tax=Enemella dayhoffiae TaxID=2016507 RepID=A0A255HD77_9ACTN|nr:shikimate dehydrogenase [Enemella dayhoffiae]
MVPGQPGQVLTPRCAVVGHPVQHSLSPAIHRAAYARLGLDWRFDRVDVAPGGLPDFVAGLGPEWRGLSVTMPHKEDAARLGEGDETVALTEVANTIVLGGDGPQVRNTDVSGFLVALRAHGIDRLDRVTVVGNGATARSAVAAVARLGAREVSVLCRTPQRAESVLALADRLGMAARASALGAGDLPSADLLISTVPVDGVLGRQQELARRAPVVFDSVYDPWPTPLGEAAAAHGRLALSGLDLLAGQAVEQVRWFTGTPVAFEVARASAQDGLNRHVEI